MCLLVVLGDISVVMETKHLRIRVQRQGSDVLNVAIVRRLWWCKVQTTVGEPGCGREETIHTSSSLICICNEGNKEYKDLCSYLPTLTYE